MILEFLCNILFALTYFLVGLFPKFPSFSNLNVSLAPLFYIINFGNMFVDVRTVSTCLIVILVVFNIKFVWSILMWLVRKIPGVS